VNNVSVTKAVVMAAGKGTRMKSDLPKVLHKVCGMPMVEHVLSALAGIGVDKPIVVIGHGAEKVREVLQDKADYAIQAEQLGTGHAVMQAEGLLQGIVGDVVVVCGDTPLITSATLEELVTKHREYKAAATLLTAVMDNPTGYGRVIRQEGIGIQRIIEEKDANPEQKQVKEIYSGIACFNIKLLLDTLKLIQPNNAQGEYYITDVFELLASNNHLVEGVILSDEDEIMGINNRVQMAEAEKILRKRIAEYHMYQGVTVIDPASTFIDKDVSIGVDTVIYPFTIIEGKTEIGEACNIGPSSRLVDAKLGDNVKIENSIVLSSQIGNKCTIGPFAYIRPDTVLVEEVKVGDFVEIKKSTIGKGSKVPHLSYIGDSLIGESVNIGAGTITCNYDGAKKSATIIKDNAFIGSNTNLVAPVEVGTNAVIAAGSTITKNVPSGALAVARNKQSHIENWVSKKENS
jgi:bifunctional UDP-N-acetylglucosamine pyrophosphorylase / glucosamine-1-phosphate N-acetyltransferase